MSIKLKLGFIGGGLNSAVGRTHKIAAEMDSKFEIVCGAFSRQETINEKTGEEYGLTKDKIYQSWEDLLAKEHQSIDAVVILTPTTTHKDIILKALEYKLPIICEKALVSNLEDAKQIIDAVNLSKGFLTVIYNYTGYPMVREIREMVKNGILGSIHQIQIEMPQEGFLRLTNESKAQTIQEWRLKDDEVPIVSTDLGVHLHNMIQYIVGEKALNLVAKQNNYGNFKNIIDNVSCIAEYTNNITCNFWYGKTALGCSNGLKIRVFGQKGSVEWFQLRPEEVSYNDNMGNRHKLDKGSSSLTIASQDRYSRFKAGHPAGFIEAFANYYMDIAIALKEYKQTGKSNYNNIFTAEDAYESLNLTYAMDVSDKKKAWVSI